ncbi:MAG: DJ-1/PfpI family protein [Clostridiales bacterium]|nr:DJ-1/PfpI family protein [Clostridiales bacterium]
MTKVYIFLADGFEEVEALTVVDLLRRADMDIAMVSLNGTRMVTGSHNITVQADMVFEDNEFKDADLLVLPGGMPGTTTIMNHEGLDKLLKEYHAKGKHLAAICAAPTVLGQKGMLKGKNATCFTGMEEQLLGANVMDVSVVVDGMITTSKGLGTAIDFSLSLIKSFKGEEEAKKMASEIQYKHYN